MRPEYVRLDLAADEFLWSPSLYDVIEDLDGVLAPVASEVAAVAVDHRQAGTHVAGTSERSDRGVVEEDLGDASGLLHGGEVSGARKRDC
jgi:hypothetical protein